MTTAPMVSHAKERARERYAVNLNRRAYWSLVDKIQRGGALLVERVSNTRAVYIVDGMVVVYSRKFRRIVTFLPRDCRELRFKEPS